MQEMNQNLKRIDNLQRMRLIAINSYSIALLDNLHSIALLDNEGVVLTRQ